MATYRFSIASATASEVSVDIAIAWPKTTVPSPSTTLSPSPSTPTPTPHVHTIQERSSLTPLISFLLIENDTFQGFTCVCVYVCQAFESGCIQVEGIYHFCYEKNETLF